MFIYGKFIREQMRQEFSAWCQGKNLELAVIRLGDDPSALFFVKGIQSYIKDLCIRVNVFQFAPITSEERLIKHIQMLNDDPLVTAILLQKPFPPGWDDNRVVDTILPVKDIEGVHTANLGKLVRGEPGVRPVTPKSVIKILKENGIQIAGKQIAVLGRSANVGSPLALMLTRENATVTVCHSHTPDIARITRPADIVVSAVGQSGFVTPDMVEPGSILVDVGANVDENGKMVGDVSPEAAEKAAVVTAVPGGVGALTVAELFDNLRLIYEEQQKLNHSV